MVNVDKRNKFVVVALSVFFISGLLSAGVLSSFLSYSTSAFAQPSNESPFKGNVTGAIMSEPGDEKEKVDAGANMSSSGSYKPSYPRENADERRPFTIHTEKHLYKPGEEVNIEGSIWSSLIDDIGSDVTVVTLNVTDNKGNMTVSEDEIEVGADGAFSGAFTLPDDAELGSYSMNAVITLDTSVLDSLSANIKSKLETSARFEVVSSNAFAVNAEGENFEVDIASNSTVKNFEFMQQDKKVSFLVDGETGTRGVTQITIPKALLSGEMMVSIDGNVIPPESSDVVAIADTEEGLTLEINYHHSEHIIEVSGTNVVPEFPLAMIVMAVAISSVVVAFSMMRRGSLLR
jgi:hypothetical protein